MKHLGLAAAIAVSVILSSSAGNAGVPEVKPANDFEGVSYSVTSTGTVVVVAGLREIGGKVAVCGLVWFEKTVSNTTKVIEVKFTDKIKYAVGGKALQVNSRLFKRYPNAEEAKAGVARCSVTKVAWDKSYASAKLKVSMGPVRVTD